MEMPSLGPAHKHQDEVREILNGVLDEAVHGDREAQEFLQMFGPWGETVLTPGGRSP